MKYFVNTFRHDDDYGLLFVCPNDDDCLIAVNDPNLIVEKTDSHIELSEEEYKSIAEWNKDLEVQAEKREYEHRLYILMKAKGYYSNQHRLSAE